jgi:hypothetical protein
MIVDHTNKYRPETFFKTSPKQYLTLQSRVNVECSEKRAQRLIRHTPCECFAHSNDEYIFTYPHVANLVAKDVREVRKPKLAVITVPDAGKTNHG